MTLRLRFTLFATCLVALVLALSGTGLYQLLSRSLYTALDASLTEASGLLISLVEHDAATGQLLLADEGDALPTLRPDLFAALYDPAGRLVDQVGRLPAGLKIMPPGWYDWQDWRVRASAVPGGTLLTLRPQDIAEQGLDRFLSGLLVFAPLSVLLAFGLGYVLAGRALAPVNRLTQAAYRLAERRAWRERLPEPAHHDELWRLAQGTNVLLAALENMIERERRFTDAAAHELRTPLTVLLGRLEQASEQTGTSPAARPLQQALAAGEQLLALSEKLLLLARTESVHQLTTERLALNELVWECAEALRPLFKARALALTLELPALPVWVRADGEVLAVAVHNLLDNALKFTERGGVLVIVRGVGTDAVLTVEDSGPGIPPEALPLVFQRFYQSDARYRRFGSGLGLTLVLSVATWHGGAVLAENRDGGGARLTLRLPRQSEDV